MVLLQPFLNNLHNVLTQAFGKVYVRNHRQFSSNTHFPEDSMSSQLQLSISKVIYLCIVS